MSQHLESWLASATLGLALSERQRIYEEISAHVTDAIAHQTAQGLSELDAEARAIQDLGDPQAARAAFQRTCYTLSDEIRLEKLLERSWWTLPYAFYTAAAPILLVVLTWFKVPINFNLDIGLVDWQYLGLMFVSALIFFNLFYFEPQIKRWLYQRFSSHGVIAAQAFMALLAAQNIHSALEYCFTYVNLVALGHVSSITGTGFIVLTLAYRWIAQQVPLTLKTIRRTRA